MTATPVAPTAGDVLAAAHELAPSIAARAAEIETARRLPRDLLHQLVSAGCFRLLQPRSHGGPEAELTDALALYEALARADGSTGWTVMIGSAAWCDLAGLPRASFDALFDVAADVIVAGAFNPTGSVTGSGGGYVVDGRWAFASGCEHAHWLWANGVEKVVDGAPVLRAAVLPRDEVEIEDTWHSLGLCGTGSHHFRIENRAVAPEWTFVPMADPPCVDTPIVRVPPPALYSLAVAAVSLGIARGAVDDVTAIAATKHQILEHLPLSNSPRFQLDLAEADTALRAARALLHEVAAEAWAVAVAGDELTLDQRARVRAAAAWTATRAAAAVGTCHRAAGSSSVYVDCPLPRRLRDINTLTQHFLVRGDALTTAGAIFAGADVDLIVY